MKTQKLTPGTRLLTYDQAREKLGIENQRTFFNLINKGIFKNAVVKVPGMRPKIREDILNQIIEENTAQSLA